MPLTLSRSFAPNPPASAKPITDGQPIEWLRHAGQQAFNQSTAIVRLNFDWMRRMILDIGRTSVQIAPNPGDWTVNWISLGIRHQASTSALTRALKRQSGASLSVSVRASGRTSGRTSGSASVSASPTPAADDRAPPTTLTRSVDVR
jgi:hypothetical protein